MAHAGRNMAGPSGPSICSLRRMPVGPLATSSLFFATSAIEPLRTCRSEPDGGVGEARLARDLPNRPRPLPIVAVDPAQPSAAPAPTRRVLPQCDGTTLSYVEMPRGAVTPVPRGRYA